MKRSQTIVLLFVTAGLLSGCRRNENDDNTRPNTLRYKRDAQGQVMHDDRGNPLYEDDEGQQYRSHGGMFFPMFTRAAGFSTIPGTGIAAPATSAGVSQSSITSRTVPATRGGFGSTGASHSSRSSGFGFSSGG